jgi:hypothetical protein
MADIENEHTRGVDAYPNTLSTAYDMLINYGTPPTTSFQSQDGGLSFYNKGDPAKTGRGGRGGRYVRGGCGGQGRGRGTSRDDSNSQTADAHVAEETTPASNEIAQTSEDYSLAIHPSNSTLPAKVAAGQLLIVRSNRKRRVAHQHSPG